MRKLGAKAAQVSVMVICSKAPVKTNFLPNLSKRKGLVMGTIRVCINNKDRKHLEIINDQKIKKGRYPLQQRVSFRPLSFLDGSYNVVLASLEFTMTQGWLQTLRDLPTSAFHVLGFNVCTSTSALFDFSFFLY